MQGVVVGALEDDAYAETLRLRVRGPLRGGLDVVVGVRAAVVQADLPGRAGEDGGDGEGVVEGGTLDDAEDVAGERGGVF